VPLVAPRDSQRLALYLGDQPSLTVTVAGAAEELLVLKGGHELALPAGRVRQGALVVGNRVHALVAAGHSSRTCQQRPWQHRSNTVATP